MRLLKYYINVLTEKKQTRRIPLPNGGWYVLLAPKIM